MMGKGVLFVSAICEHVLYKTMGPMCCALIPINRDRYMYIYKDLFYVLNIN